MDQVVISYAKEDFQMAERIAMDLRAAGINPWLDAEKLIPGQNWKNEITKAIKESRYFLAIISSNSISKTGYVQKELKIAFEIADRFSPSDIFIIPVRLDECNPIDERIQDLHWADLFPSYEKGMTSVLKVFNKAFNPDYTLSWDGWWKKIMNLAKLFKEPFDRGTFVPSVVFGISNGGLVLSDMLAREVFRGIPVLSLWANRWVDAGKKTSLDQSCFYFDNDFNISSIAALKKSCSRGGEIGPILLLDDLIFTSSTAIQATNFIEREIAGKVDLLYVPLFARRIEYLNALKEYLIPGYKDGKVFDITEKEYFDMVTPKGVAMFPYRKDLGVIE